MEKLGSSHTLQCRIDGGRDMEENEWSWGIMVSLRCTPASRGRRNGMHVRVSEGALMTSQLSLTRSLVALGPAEPRHFSTTTYVLDNVLYLKINQIQDSKCKA